MWYRNENGGIEKPSDMDKTTSSVYVYVRKDFEFVEGTEEIPAHWAWMERKIKKDDWELYVQTETNTANIDYIAMMTDVEIPTEGDEEE